MTDEQEEQLDEILAEYLQQQEAGESVDPESLIAAHPEFAEEMREFFADQQQMQGIASPIAVPLISRRPVLDTIRYFGDYELLEEIARGGMGIVYKARQASLNRIVAVKMILAGNLASETDAKRFQTEAESAASLKHPNIVVVHEVGRHEGQHYFSMDYVDGKNLSEIVRDNPLPAKTAARYIRQIAEAIEYAHQQGTLHRDLKPSNVLIDANDDVQITDFGLALRVEGDSELTASGQVLGTPSYMSPEQAQGKRGLVGVGSEVYSLGAILYELLTGRPPFRAESAVETLRQVIETEPLSPRLLNPSVPKDLETVCLKCLQKEPHKRYATAQHLADDLRRYLGGEPILARPISRPARVWRWCKRCPAAASLALLAPVVVGLFVALWVGLRYNAGLEVLADQLQDALYVVEGAKATAVTAREAEKKQRIKTEHALEESEEYFYFLRIAAAERAWRLNNVARASRLLEECPRHLRNWEWSYLRRLCQVDHATMPTDEPQNIDLSPSGKYVAVVQNPKNHTPFVRILEVDGTRVGKDRIEPIQDAYLAKFVDDDRVMIVRTDHGLDLLDLPSKQTSLKIKSVAGYGEQVVQLAVSADAQSCALRLRKSTRHRRIVLVSWNDVEEPLAMTLPAACLALSPDGRHLAVGTGRVTRSTYSRVSPGNVKIHDAKTGRVVREFGDKHGAVLALAFTRDGRYVVSGHSDSSVRVWSANSGESVATCRGHSGSVLGLAAVADNDQIVSCGEDSTVRLWRLSTGEQVRIFRGHQATVTGIAASKTGSTLASVSEDQSVRLWDSMQRQSSLLVATTPMRQCLGVAFNANDEMLGLVTHRGMMRLIDVRDNKEAYSFAARGRSIVFGENGTFYTLGGDVIAAWKTRSREPIFEKAAPARKHGSRIARSSDGRYIAAGTVDGIVIRKASNGDVVRTLETDGQQKSPIYGIALSPDGKLVAYVISLSYATCEVHVVDHANGERVRIWKQRQHCIWDLKFSPDGNLLAGAGGRSLGRDPGRVMVWNVGTGKLVHELKDHRYGAWSVAFHPDGRRLASGAGGYDRAAPARMGGEIKIWDLRFGQELLTLRDHTSAIMSLEFSNDGTMLASGSADRTARIWMTHSAPTAKRTP